MTKGLIAARQLSRVGRLRRPASAGLTGSRTAELSDSETIDSIDGCCSSVPIV